MAKKIVKKKIKGCACYGVNSIHPCYCSPFTHKNCTDKKLGLLFDMDGKKARKELQALLDKGDRVLPSENCKHFDPQEGCQCRFHESEVKTKQEN